MPPLLPLLEKCLAARAALFDLPHVSAFRLFNGFTEGLPDLVIDIYARTLIVSNYADPPQRGQQQAEAAAAFLLEQLPWLAACILKIRSSPSLEERRGRRLFGVQPDDKIREHGVWYAVNPVMHQDAGLYLDTRNLRRWALDHLEGGSVLNTFAYTGSLGVAALAGGAARVVQLDRNAEFLGLARKSCSLNGLAVREQDFVRADFFRQVAAFKRQGARFDCVFLDPPFFSAGRTGVIDQVSDAARLINKVRPLVNDGGALVAINNAVFVTGRAYMQTLESLCADGYLSIDELVPVPDDFTGYPDTRTGAPIADPAPFNHSTKIAVLKVRRKIP